MAAWGRQQINRRSHNSAPARSRGRFPFCGKGPGRIKDAHYGHACAVWVFAQTYPSQNPSSSQTGQSSSQTSSQSSSSSGNETTIQGCLNGSGGNYTLTDSSGKTWQLTGDTAKLSDHVGHTVEIKGTTSSSGSESSGATGSSGSSSSANAQSTINVTSMKHIFEHLHAEPLKSSP